MPAIEINDIDKVGAIRDQEGFILPPEAWTFSDNMRFTNGGAERHGGKTQVFGTPGVAPHFAMPIENSTQTYWLYVSLTKAYVYDGTNHTNITRQTAGVDVNYGTGQTRDWNGTLLGGVPILNNGTDPPQYWSALSPGTKLAALPNWPASTTAKVIRSFGPYLVALNVTKGSTLYPHMVKWSQPADPGSIPTSWDNTDPTVDAGEVDLPDTNAGLLIDGLPLRGHFYCYKENSVWRMNTIGGTFIFDFDTFLENSGLLAPRCVAITGDGLNHIFASQDDIVIHNGNSAKSILDQKCKQFLVNAIDQVNYVNSFMFTDSYRAETWFCYPESGQTNPNRAIVYNYKTGTLSEGFVNFRNAIMGIVPSSGSDTWASVTGSWDAYVGPWSKLSRRRVVCCGTDATKFYEHDEGVTNDGSSFTGTLQRTGLSVIGKKRNGEWINDFMKRKMFTRIWIKATGGPFNVRLGVQDYPNGAVTWKTSQSFDPASQRYLDFVGSGNAVALEFTGTVAFKILGYKPELSVIGNF